MDFETLSYPGLFAASGATMLAGALLAGLSERRERRRRDLDRISTMPWGLVSVLLSMLAIILLATAARAWFTSAG